MEYCKYCQAELAEDSAVCPNCGKDNALEEVQPVEEAAAAEQEQETAVEATAEATEENVEAAAEEKAEAETEAEAASEETAAEQTEEQAPVQTENKKTATPGKIALAVAAVIVLLAALIALVLVGMKDRMGAEQTPSEPAQSMEGTVTLPGAVSEDIEATIPADGEPGTVTEKGTYTVSDEEAWAQKDTVVATMGDSQLTNGLLQVYYWSMVNSYLSSDYGYYVMMYGALDYTQPLDSQVCVENREISWQQFFLQEALNYWQMNQALAMEAENAGFELSQEDQEYLDALPTTLATTAAQYGMETVDELLLHNIGPGAGIEEFINYQQTYYRGRPYYDAELAKFVPTQEDLDAFFTEHEEEYAAAGVTRDQKLVDVRHILLIPEGGTVDETGTTVYTDEAWAACEAAAQAILEEWKQGDATEESFAQLANTHSTDPGSNTNGGLYEQVYEGQMVEEFEAWCFDESRATGDTGLVKTSYGWHIMYYVSSEPMWVYYAEADWVGYQADDFILGLAEKHPMEVDYSAVAIGNVNLAG